MPHVSPNKLHSKGLEQLLDKLGHAIAQLRGRAEVDLFFNDLLTLTERIMLAKRLAIVFMLEKGFTFAQISSVLKVSEATISMMRERIDRGGKGFRLVVKKLEADVRINKFFEKIEELFKNMSVPPKVGKGRWKGVLYM
jgi:TrpR-related protein YerC/YecD